MADLGKWWGGATIDHFYPEKRTTSKPVPDFYIDTNNNFLMIVPHEENRFVTRIDDLKTVRRLDAFFVIDSKTGDRFPLRDYQQEPIKNWLMGQNDHSGMLDIIDGELFYITNDLSRMKIGAQLKAQPSVNLMQLEMSLTEVDDGTTIHTMTTDFKGYSDFDGTALPFNKGDHKMSPDFSEDLNTKLVAFAINTFGGEVNQNANKTPKYLFNGSNINYCDQKNNVGKFLWTEPKICEKSHLIWPGITMCKISGAVKSGLGGSSQTLEKLPRILGYLTIFKVSDDVQRLVAYDHPHSTVPSQIKQIEKKMKLTGDKNLLNTLYGRKNYEHKWVDAVIVTETQMKNGVVRPVACIALTNPYSKI